MIDRITQSNITILKPNEVFVFGSNLSGIHGAGAAKLAHNSFGAEWGKGEGLQGNSYAIPTKDKTVYRTLSIAEIKPYVDRFIDFAKENEELTFLVTEIGCGLAGLKPAQVAPLFANVIEFQNIHLPLSFWKEFI